MFVLVADSQSVFQQILAHILTEQGVDFHLCKTGAEVVEAMSVRTVDLFLVTMNLPDIDGPALCRQIRQTIKDDCIPIIILTSEESGQSFSGAFAAGATDIFRRNKIEHFSDYLAHLTQLSKPMNARVMVLEDSRVQRQILEQTLTGWGLEVQAFDSARPALESHLDEPFDIILTDIELNGLESGLDFVRDVRQQPFGVGDVPIIAVTAYLSDSTRVNFLARGIDRCMLKPILMPELRSEVKKQIDIRKARLALDQERRMEAEKNNAKTEFMARMSHELRTSLNAIIGFSELQLISEAQDTETLDYASKINSAGKLLLELINEVLDLSRIESGNVKINFENISLADVLNKCQSVMNGFAKEHSVALSFNNKLNDTSVLCDPTRLTEVLLNLISNGIKYNKKGGKVEVVTELIKNKLVRISVIDNGIGISEKDVKKIFEPFSRVHTSSHQAEGTGIGLAIADQLVELMGGSLGFSSEVGRGSNFWLDLPRGGIAKQKLEDIKFSPVAELMPCKVVYVDDNPTNCLLLKKWFSKQIYGDISIASNARDGLLLVKKDRPDILITDIQMPEESGYWLLEQIRARPKLADLPVIALSAMAMEDEVMRGKHSGFTAYLTKPFDFKVLINTLNSIEIERKNKKYALDFNNDPNYIDS